MTPPTVDELIESLERKTPPRKRRHGPSVDDLYHSMLEEDGGSASGEPAPFPVEALPMGGDAEREGADPKAGGGYRQIVESLPEDIRRRVADVQEPTRAALAEALGVDRHNLPTELRTLRERKRFWEQTRKYDFALAEAEFMRKHHEAQLAARPDQSPADRGEPMESEKGAVLAAGRGIIGGVIRTGVVAPNTVVEQVAQMLGPEDRTPLMRELRVIDQSNAALTDAGRDARWWHKWTQEYMGPTAGVAEGTGNAEWWAYNIGGMIPYTAGVMAGTAVGGPALGFAVAMAGESGGRYQELIDQGVDPKYAAYDAAITGAIKATLEQAVAGKLLGKLSGGAGQGLLNKLMSAGDQALFESSQEVASELVDIVADAARGKDTPPREVLQRLYHTAILSAAFGVLTGGAADMPSAINELGKAGSASKKRVAGALGVTVNKLNSTPLRSLKQRMNLKRLAQRLKAMRTVQESQAQVPEAAPDAVQDQPGVEAEAREEGDLGPPAPPMRDAETLVPEAREAAAPPSRETATEQAPPEAAPRERASLRKPKEVPRAEGTGEAAVQEGPQEGLPREEAEAVRLRDDEADGVAPEEGADVTAPAAEPDAANVGKGYAYRKESPYSTRDRKGRPYGGKIVGVIPADPKNNQPAKYEVVDQSARKFRVPADQIDVYDAAQEQSPSAPDPSGLSWPDLKARAKAAGVKVKGKHDVLANKVREAEAAQEAQPAAEAAPESEQAEAPQEAAPEAPAEGERAAPPAEYGRQNKLVTTEEKDAALKRLQDKLKRLRAGIPADAIGDLATVGLYHFEAGARTFGAWSKQMVGSVGERIRPHLQELWDHIEEGRAQVEAGPVEARAATGEQAEQAQRIDIPVTSVKNEVANEMRRMRGVGELEGVAPESQQAWLDAAADTLRTDPDAGARLVNELAKTPRNLSDREVAVLQMYYRTLNNNFERVSNELFDAKDAGDAVRAATAQAAVAEHMALLAKAEEATKAAGREWGRAGVSRQIMLAKDFSLAAMVRKARVAQGGEALSADQHAKITALAKRVKDLEAKLAKASAKSDTREPQRRVDQQIDEDVKAFQKKRGRRTLGKRKQTPKRNVVAPELDLADPASITRYAREIQRQQIEGGMRDRDQIVGVVQAALQKALPDVDVTRDMTMEALSAYGQFTTPSQNEVDQVIRDQNAQLLQLTKLRVLEEATRRAEQWRAEGLTDDQIVARLKADDLMVKATGFLRDKPSDVVRHLTAQVNDAKKQIPVTTEAQQGQLQTALDAAKRAVRNRIADLQWEINNHERIVRKRTGLTADTELTALRDERDALVEEHRKMFPPPGATEAQKNAAAEKALDRAIAELERQVDEGDVAPKPKAPKRSTPAIDAKRARLDALRAQRDALRAVLNPPLTAEERARRIYEANLRRRIADYKDRIARGDFETKKKEPRPLSPGELKLKRLLEKEKRTFNELAAKYHLANLSPQARLVDLTRETAHLSRAVMTSIDLSAVGRQGSIAIFAHPGLGARSAWAMLKALVSKQAEFNTAEAIRNDPLGPTALTAGLAITEDGGKITRQEEAYMGRWAKKVPGVAASARAYTTFLNNMRFELFKLMVDNVGRTGRVTPDEAKVIAKYINVATGRADLKALNRAAAEVNTVFFAPRYVASRFQYLAMPFYLPFSKTSGRVKKAIANEYARTFTGAAAFIGSVMALGYLAADDDDDIPTMEIDPRSADFLKIKIGDTRVDPTGGLSSVIVLSSRLLKGEMKGASGDIKTLGGDGYKPTTRWTLVGNFLRYKLAPVPGAMATALNDMVDPVGQKQTPLRLTGGLFLPLSVREVADAMKGQDVPTGTALSTLALFGMSANTYGPKTTYLDASAEERKEIFAKDLERFQWDDPLPAYNEFLSPRQLRKIDEARQRNAGLRLWQAVRDRPTREEEREKPGRQEKWRADQREALGRIQGLPKWKRREAFNAYWKSKRHKRGSAAYRKNWRKIRRLPE